MAGKLSLRLNRGVALVIVVGILILINIIGSYLRFSIDLTEEKRYTLTDATKELLSEVDNPIHFEVLLGGDFPAGFKRLQRATREMLEEFRSHNSYIDFTFKDPNEGSKEQLAAFREQLSQEGVLPTNLRIKDQGSTVEKLIYPYALMTTTGRALPVNLLESEVPGMPPDLILNNSVALLEYKLASAIERQMRQKMPNIVLLKGHGELKEEQTLELWKMLRPSYNLAFLDLDSVFRINPAVDLLIISKPLGPFSEPDKFKIDQYVMKGGRIIWLIDPLSVNLDSIRSQGNYIPLEFDLNIDDLLFNYGARVQKNLVLDMECSGIPLQVGVVGGTPQYDIFPWFYHPTVIPTSSHPIVKNLSPVHFEFPASVDTIKTSTSIEKTILMASSDYTRMQYPPVQLSFEILRYDPDPSKFDKPSQPFVVLLEGVFPSHFTNRVPQAFLDSLTVLDDPFRPESQPTSMIVVGDGDLFRNPFNLVAQESRPMGYNIYDRRQYANKDLALNMVEYLLDKRGLIEARSREVRLRMLDKVRASEEKLFWQVLNLVGPLLFVLLTGILYYLVRRRRFTHFS
jgi:ABC-2 type transport system permease protein